MHALLVTYLALYSVGAGATTPPPVGGYQSSDSAVDCEQLIDAASTCLDNEHGADTEYSRYKLSHAHARTALRSCVQIQFDKARAANRSCSVRSFTDCLTEALGDETNKEHEAGAKHFVGKITSCMQQKLPQVRARAFFVLMTTVLAGHGDNEHKTEMPFEMPLMMTTSGRTS
nr:uncharacterized protein LOC129383384 isoform X1 [Dermacentor andersoni]XP_054923887.1 uncharacterized protein LOC129383384 isoform X1 [Dermacentor andersoni]